MSAHLFFSSDYQQCRSFLENNWQLNFSPQPDLFCFNENKEGISIEQIRDLESTIYTRPYQAPEKTIIFANFDQASIPAQNAFLKMLEEHPSYIRFILHTSNEHKVLETIKSRCQIQIISDHSDQEKSIGLAETFIATIENSNHAQLIDWCTSHKDRDEALAFLTDLLKQLHTLNTIKPSSKHLFALEQINLALNQIEQNFNVLMSLENCLFTIKSRF